MFSVRAFYWELFYIRCQSFAFQHSKFLCMCTARVQRINKYSLWLYYERCMPITHYSLHTYLKTYICNPVSMVVVLGKLTARTQRSPYMYCCSQPRTHCKFTNDTQNCNLAFVVGDFYLGVSNNYTSQHFWSMHCVRLIHITQHSLGIATV